MLERQLERLQRARTPDSIVVATTTVSRDEPIVDLATRLGVPVTRGSEDDVLDRYMQAVTMHDADVIVRTTADCPLIDPFVLDRCVTTLLDDPTLDYVSNTLERTYPRGLDVEVITRQALEAAENDATDPADREHVTRYVWRQPEIYRLASVTDTDDHSQLRWTVDTADDLNVIRAIYRELYPSNPSFGYRDVLAHADAFPDVHALNAHVRQRP